MFELVLVAAVTFIGLALFIVGFTVAISLNCGEWPDAATACIIALVCFFFGVLGISLLARLPEVADRVPVSPPPAGSVA